MSRISSNIKKFRTKSGMTQEFLANEIHVTRQTVSSWETGRTQPDIQVLQTLADVFGIEIEELIYGKIKNAQEEKEKLLFGSTLVTVLSVLGCLLIGAGVVMIFIKYWRDFPDMLKLLTCFIPALLGQGVGIYTYLRKKESLAWCEGASVLWMLGTGVTTAVLLSRVSDSYMDYGIVYFFMATSFFILMLIFRSLAPLAIVQGLSVTSFAYSLDNMQYYYIVRTGEVNDVIRFVLALIIEGVFLAAVIYASKKLYRKENNIIRYRFSEWINFVAVIAFIFIAVSRTRIEGASVSVAVLIALLCFIISRDEENFASPYKFTGVIGTAAAFCFLAIISVAEFYGEVWITAITALVGFLPVGLLLNEKFRPRNKFLTAYGILNAAALCLLNIAGFFEACRWNYRFSESSYSELLKTADDIMEKVFILSFPISLAALVMLIIYGAKERKLFYLNLGFILSCFSVIAKLYLLDLGLIVTGLLLIVCGAGLLFVNYKIARIREMEKAASADESEVEER